MKMKSMFVNRLRTYKSLFLKHKEKLVWLLKASDHSNCLYKFQYIQINNIIENKITGNYNERSTELLD